MRAGLTTCLAGPRDLFNYIFLAKGGPRRIKELPENPIYCILMAMALHKVRTIPDPVLYKPGETVTEFNAELRTLVHDMFETMYHEEGVGLAAPQIGISKRVIVIDLENAGFEKGAYINPEVIETSTEIQDGEEGCLSVPGLVADLKRPKRVKVQYQDVFGETRTVEGEDLFARALLHEIDHTLGKVFIDLLEPEIYKEAEKEIEEIKSGKRKSPIRKPAYRDN